MCAKYKKFSVLEPLQVGRMFITEGIIYKNKLDFIQDIKEWKGRNQTVCKIYQIFLDLLSKSTRKAMKQNMIGLWETQNLPYQF